MRNLLDRIPYARFLGVTAERTPDGLECLLPFRDEIVGNPLLPAIHGGVIGAFLELTALVHLIDENEGGHLPKPITFGIDYLRSAGPEPCRARAEVVKLGRRIANVHVVAWQADPQKPVAAGNGKFLLSGR
jgi:uncharacterized protein (TIGR00369 family)